METGTITIDELMYSIGDVSKICDVPGYTIRFWEKEFGNYLLPTRTLGKQRRYSDSHIHQILHIKKLLWEDKFSIAGAKRMLYPSHAVSTAPSNNVQSSVDTQKLAQSIALFIQDHLTKSQFSNNLAL